jgi:hypothetical protein
VESITFVEVKSGKSTLTGVERSVREAVEQGRASFETVAHPSLNGLREVAEIPNLRTRNKKSLSSTMDRTNELKDASKPDNRSNFDHDAHPRTDNWDRNFGHHIHANYLYARPHSDHDVTTAFDMGRCYANCPSNRCDAVGARYGEPLATWKENEKIGAWRALVIMRDPSCNLKWRSH